MMTKKFMFLVTLFFLLVIEGIFATEISETRMTKITSIISRFQEAGEDLSDPDVRSAILKEISKYYPLEPESKANLIGHEELSKLVREKVHLKFPDSHDSLDKRAKQSAEKNFQKAKINDYVKLTYEKGVKTYKVEGYFFGYGAMENSINVGGNIVAIFDLIPEDRAKFDDKFREYLTDQFIKKQIRDYYTRKADYSIELLKEQKESIVKYNENVGYVFARCKWMTPKELATTLIDLMLSKGQIAKVDPIPIETSEIKPTPSTTLDEQPSAENTTKDTKTKKIEDVRRKAEIDQQKIKTKYAGIDSDQGYNNAIWWMKHQDVNLLFEPLVNKAGEGDVENLNFDTGPIQKVELFFFYGYFYKVVVHFKIADPRAMEILYRRIVETYGKTDQEKTEEAAPPNPAPEGELAPVVEEIVIPQELTLTWTGKETLGTLYLKLTPDKKAYSTFVLTKENPKVMKEVSLLIEKERKQKTEAELKKLLDEYGGFKVK